MAVTPATIPLPKGEPDIGKLNTFNGRTVQVTKYLQPRGMLGQMVVPPTEMTVQQITQLLTQLPIQHGAGYYKFTVADTGGTGDDVWMTRLGPPEQEIQQMAVNGLPAGSGPITPGAPLGEGVTHLGHGFYYDQTRGLLTTPWREIVSWSEGQPLPKAPPTVGSAAATAWGPQNGQQPGGWGGWPAIDVGESKQVAELKAQIADQARQREMDSLRAEMRRSQEDTNKVLTALMEKITARPSGPDPEVQRRLDESERRAERAEQRAEEERREAARRLEEDRREATRRAEIQAMNDKYERGMREAAANKTDPMLPLLANMLTSMQAASAETIRAIKETTEAQATSGAQGVQMLVQHLASNAVTPVQLIGMLNAAKGDGAEATRMILGTAKEALTMQREVTTSMLDLANQGGQPAWVGVATAALDRIGTIGAAIAERNAQQAQQQQAQQAQQQRQQRQPQQFRPMSVPAQPQVSQMNGTPALNPSAPIVIPPHPGANRPGRVDTGDRPEGTEYDATTDEFILTDGRRVKHNDVMTNGWKAVLTQPHKFASASPATTPTPGPTLVSVPTVDVMPPAPAPKRGRGKKAKEVAPPPTDPRGYSISEMRELESDEVELVCRKLTDEVFFGPTLYPYVQQLRGVNMAAADVAKQIVQAQVQLSEAKIEMPPAMEVLLALHVEVVIDRLLPEADDEYRSVVVEETMKLMGIEEDEDDDGKEAS